MNKGHATLSLLAAALAATLAHTGLCFAAGVARAGDIVVSEPFARASAGMATAGAAYLTLRNDGGAADRLTGAATPAAGHAELHTHIRDGDVMRMREVDFIEVPADQTVRLEPGGLHVMLLDLKAPLLEGTMFPLTLTFASAGAITVEVPVRSAAAMAPMHHHRH